MFAKKIFEQETVQRKHVSFAEVCIIITCIFWLIEKIISYKVWGTHRLFPLVPISDFFLLFPSVVHDTLFSISIICLCMNIIVPKQKWGLIILLISEIASCMLDQNRWQPWEYQFIFTTAILLAYRNKEVLLRNCLMFLLASTYIYSGLQKMNSRFLYAVWDEIIFGGYLKIPAYITHKVWIYNSGYLLSIFETLMGIGLLFSTTKNRGAKALIGMHIFNLLLLGPMGLNYNVIVWPWNACMSAYLYLLFIYNQPARIELRTLAKGFGVVVVLFWGIMPAFNFIGKWDEYLSSSLYSGKLLRMNICVQDTNATMALRPYYSKKVKDSTCKGATKINLQYWAMKEMNVPPYPERRIYRKVKEAWEKKYPKAAATFYLSHYPEQDVAKEVMY